GYVFQDGRLFPHMRVRDNLEYGAQRADGRSLMALEDAAAFLGIAHLLDRWPRTLSGGEAQRVAIGRALLSGPRFLLMDEPLAALDRARREEVLTVIERLRDAVRLPILYVSHDRHEVERLAGVIVEL
ncbi:MAG: molybdenum ABC transporter ATP-binding protein, partial [Novosphingobium sp.]|nr:molybdenum ABC transporter ATP-binding protein [Novosphingobium sp.]